MPPAQELTFPRPSVPALSLPRVAVRYRWGIARLVVPVAGVVPPRAPRVRSCAVDSVSRAWALP